MDKNIFGVKKEKGRYCKKGAVMRNKFLLSGVLLFAFMFAGISFILAGNIFLSDQGTDVKNIGTGDLLDGGDLTVEIWDAVSGGTQIYTETFSNSINNGSWNVMLGAGATNLILEYGALYYKNYLIGADDINFAGNADRLAFFSPLGDVGSEDLTQSLDLSGTITADSFIGDGSLLTGISSLWTDVSGNAVYNSGNVGIGTSSPQKKLEIKDGGLFITGSNIAPSTGEGIEIYYNDAGNIGVIQAYDYTGGSPSNIKFAQGQTYFTGGNVGIGTSSPDRKLHVYGDANTYTLGVQSSTTTGQGYGLAVFAGTNSVDTALTVRNAADNSQYLIVKGDGKVGIGTTNPTAKLHVAGDLRVDGQIITAGASSSKMRVTKDNAQSFASGAATIVQYDDEVFDTLGEFSSYRFTASKSGYYSVSASFESQNTNWDSHENWQISLWKNGGYYSSGFNNKADVAVTNYQRLSQLNDIVYLSAGNYIDIRLFHYQGGTIYNENNAGRNYFSVHRLS